MGEDVRAQHAHMMEFRIPDDGISSIIQISFHLLGTRWGPESLNEDDWTTVQIFYTFLKSFYENIIIFICIPYIY